MMGLFEHLKQHAADWLEERLKISVVAKAAAKKVVPQHEQSFWYYFGGMALFLLLVQIATGLLLMVYYQPGIETSHASVAYITDKVEFGSLIRSLHSWSANLMIAVVFIHMFCAYFMKAYRRPRELTWLTGFGLFMMSLGLGFSGYLLPWDKLAFFATKVGLQIMEQTPIVGHMMADLLRGGSDVGGATISRFFELHVILLPLGMMGLLGAHLLLVQLHGMSTPYSYANKPARLRKSIPFFGDFLYHDLFIWTLMMGALVFLATASPWELGEMADPWAAAPEGIKPEWYFMFMFQILKLLPAHIGPFEGEVVGIVGFGILGALWALVPFWEGINKLTSKLATFYGIAAVVVITVGTISGYMPTPEAPLANTGTTPIATAGGGSAGAELFKQNCAACHSIGGGPLVGPDLKGISQNRDREQLANFIVDPTGSAMPKLPNIDKAAAMAMLDYIDEQSNPKPKSEASDTAAKSAEERPFTAADIENGRKVFAGITPLAQGGTACMACHSVSGIGTLGGGSLGPDLTGVYDKLGGRNGLEAWLGSIPSPTMKPLYTNHPLQPEEIRALVAYFSSVSQKKQDAAPKGGPLNTMLQHNKFFFFGFIGLVLAMVALAVLYNDRFRAVRRPLVNGQEQNKERED